MRRKVGSVGAVSNQRDIVILLPSGTLNSSLTDAINIACDPMQNPGQTQIF